MEDLDQGQDADDGEMISVSPLYPNKDVLTVIGEVCFLCFHSKTHKSWSMEDIGRVFEPPIYLKQFQIYRARDVPRGLVTYAKLDTAAEEKLINGKGLDTPEEWNSGENLWIVDLIAPWGHGRPIIKDILGSLPGLTFKTLRVKGGRKRVVEWYRASTTESWRTRFL